MSHRGRDDRRRHCSEPELEEEKENLGEPYGTPWQVSGRGNTGRKRRPREKEDRGVGKS